MHKLWILPILAATILFGLIGTAIATATATAIEHARTRNHA